MKIEKDKRYFGVYLACIICATLLSIAVIALMIYFALNDGKMYVIVLPLIAIVGDLFAFNSFNGYMKTPMVLLVEENGKITLTPDKKKATIELEVSDIKSVEMKRPVICRSGKRLILRTENEKYYLEDINDMDKAYQDLTNLLKGQN